MNNGGSISQTVVVTGGTKGMGACISQEFYEQGAHVLIGARNDNGLAKKLGERARFLKVNVQNRLDHELLVRTALEWTGRLDCYINGAGFSEWRPLDEIDETFWDEMIDTNLKGTFLGCQAAAENMYSKGCIINISSIAGKRGTANNSVYCASKFAVNGLTQSLAKELGPRGIRVNAVCPVYVKTDGLLKALANEKSPCRGADINSFLKGFAINNSALGCIPTPEEVAQVCKFLASSEASAITGQCINVDCGVLPQ